LTLCQPISDTTKQVFGLACGGTGDIPTLMTETLILVNTNNSTQLRKYANSSNSQEKIHGLIGLYFLHKKGQKLTKTDKNLLALAQVSRELINYCEGCDFSRQKQLKDLITDTLLENYFAYYKLYNWKSIR
jgi:hypothetical protein